MRSRPVLRAALVLALVPAAACSDDVPPDDTTYNCDADDRDEPFAVGLERMGPGGTLFTIVSADPVQPRRGNNFWQIRVMRSGAPVTDAAALKVTPFMPDHGHSPSVRATWTPRTEAGHYDVGPINLWMPGVWELTFEDTPAGMPRDSVLFTFCITG